jgi:hypothetical protein
MGALVKVYDFDFKGRQENLREFKSFLFRVVETVK